MSTKTNLFLQILLTLAVILIAIYYIMQERMILQVTVLLLSIGIAILYMSRQNHYEKERNK